MPSEKSIRYYPEQNPRFQRKQTKEIKQRLSQTGLTRKDEMRGKNLRAGAVYREVHEQGEQVFNKADRFSRKPSPRGLQLFLCFTILCTLANATMTEATITSHDREHSDAKGKNHGTSITAEFSAKTAQKTSQATPPVLVDTSKVRVGYDGRNLNDITSQEKERIVATQAQARRLLPYATNNEALKNILKAYPNFTIYINLNPKYNVAFFTHEHSGLYLPFKAEGYGDEEMLRILANELDHASTRQATGSFAPQKEMKVFEDLLKSANDRVQQLEKCFNQPNKKTTSNKETEEKLSALREIINQYEPIKHTAAIKQYDKDMLLKQTGVKKIGEKYLLPKGVGPNPPIEFKNRVSYVTFTKNPTSQKNIATFSFNLDDTPDERMRAFFGDWTVRYTEKSGGYGLFADSSKEGRTAERLSDVNMLPSPIRKLLFPELCEELSKMHRVNDYCARPSLR